MQLVIEKTNYAGIHTRRRKPGYRVVFHTIGSCVDGRLTRRQLVRLRDRLTKLLDDKRIAQWTVGNRSSINVSVNIQKDK